MPEWERQVRDALERAGADDLDRPRARYRREPEPLPDNPGWGLFSALQPATPWHLIGVGALLWFIGRMLGRAGLAEPLVMIGLILVVIGVLSLLLLPASARPKRWRGRLIYLDTGWRARLYRRLYRR